MIKKSVSIILCIAAIFCMFGCNNTDSSVSSDLEVVIPLTEREESIVQQMGSDINVITDDTYVNTIGELIYHPHDYSGMVFQMEGIFSSNGENNTIYRNLVNGEHTETLGLPLQYVKKEIEDGSWIRVTAIVSEIEVDGSHTTALDVVAIESFAAYGLSEIPWDGNEIHQH